MFCPRGISTENVVVFHGNSMECFTWNPMEYLWKSSRLFHHGNSMGHETGAAMLQDSRLSEQNDLHVHESFPTFCPCILFSICQNVAILMIFILMTILSFSDFSN